MVKSFSLYVLAILLSLSILGPSVMALFENNPDVEIVLQDIEEEKEEYKQGLDENEKILSQSPDLSELFGLNEDLSSHYYLVRHYGHIKDIHSPPPDLS